MKILDDVYQILIATKRPMPACFTSNVNKETGQYTKPKNFCVDFTDITPMDEYALADFVWLGLPSSDLYKKAEHHASATILMAEDIALGAFIINRLDYGVFTPLLTRNILENHLANFQKLELPADVLLSDKNIRDYFYKCEKFGQKRAGLNDHGDDDLSGDPLCFTNNANFGKYYKIFKSELTEGKTPSLFPCSE